MTSEMPRRISDPNSNAFAASGPGTHKATSPFPVSFLQMQSQNTQEIIHNKQRELQRDLLKILGKPFFSAPGFVLYDKDCVSALKKLSRSKIRFSLTVTSPPYNIGKEYEEISSIQKYVDWCKQWIQLVYESSTDTSAFWLNLGYLEVPETGLCVPIPYLLWDKTPFYLLQEVVWNYGAGVSTKKRLSPRNEKWLWYVKDSSNYTFNLDDIRDPNVKYPNQKKNGKFRCNPLGKNPSDVWQFSKVTSGANRSSKERTAHPAQFPLPIVERLVKASSKNGDFVLDPFTGSGSAGITAGALGRIFVGFEIRDDYCKAAAERYSAFLEDRRVASSQTDLFNLSSIES